MNSNRKLDVSLDGTLLSHKTNLNPMSSQSSKRDIISTSGCHFDFSLKSLLWETGWGGGGGGHPPPPPPPPPPQPVFRPHHFNFKVAHSEGLHRVNGKPWNGLKFEPLAAKIDMSQETHIQLFWERLLEKIGTQQSRKVIWDMINTLSLTFPLALTNNVHGLSCHSFKFLWRTVNSKPPTTPFGIVASTFSYNGPFLK